MATSDVLSIIQHRLDIKLKELQIVCLENVTKGKDVFAVLPTGYGKTLIYTVLPLVFQLTHEGMKPIVLVISPLVSLMKDQVQQIGKFGVESVYLGEKIDKDTQEKVQNGTVLILIMSPESLFSGTWRDTLTSPVYQQNLSVIVIDEAHCVEEWGDEFRTDYSRLQELRSLLPKSVMLALTATATKESRKKVSDVLGMDNYHLVIGSCNRPNIFYFGQETKQIGDSFVWLISKLSLAGSRTPKTIIYCRNIKSCADIYALFLTRLGIEKAYIGRPSSRNCLFAMYHHATPEKNKKFILENFGNLESTTRIVIATTAFGMGVNVPDVTYVIHWGASRTLRGFMQESGRAGRDGDPAFSIVYYHAADISQRAADTPMNGYCKLDSCRRFFLVNVFTPERSDFHSEAHFCCDNCSDACACCDCNNNQFEFMLDDEDKAMVCIPDAIDKPCRDVSKETKETIQICLQELREQMVTNCSETLLNSDIVTGFSERTISDIVNNVHYIFETSDILQDYVFDSDLASTIMGIINTHN